MKSCWKKFEKLMEKIAEKHCFTKSAGAGAKRDHSKLVVRTHVRGHLNLDVRGACVRAIQKTVATHTLPVWVQKSRNSKQVSNIKWLNIIWESNKDYNLIGHKILTSLFSSELAPTSADCVLFFSIIFL